MSKVLWLGGLLLTLATVVAPAQSGSAVLVQGGHVIPVVGDPIPGGSVLIRDGKIVAVGKDIEAPFDAKVISAEGKYVFPGIVEPMTSRGLDRANENMDLGPFLLTYDAIDPSDPFFEQSLRSGVTAIHVSQGNNCVIGGETRVVRPLGLTVSEMTASKAAGLKVCFTPKNGYDRSSQMAVLRGAFRDLDRYSERLAETLYEEDLKKKDEKLTVGPEEARKRGRKLVKASKMNEPNKNLARMREGRLDAFFWCANAMDVAAAMNFAKSQKLKDDRLTVAIGAEGMKAARMLRGLKRPVILPASQMVYSEQNRETLEREETFVPERLAKAKVPFALSDSRDPRYDAARLVRNGISRQAALEAITINAAKAAGIDQAFGSIEVGKSGDLVILSGDPLDAMSWVDSVIIEGHHVYERAKDLRLRELMKGVHRTEERARRAEAAKKKAAEAKKAKPAKKAATSKPGKATKADGTKASGAKKPSGAKKN